jgi:cohesin complex subunit SCC1
VDTSNEISKNLVPEDDGGGDFPQGDDDLLPFDDGDDVAAAPPLPDDSSLHETGMADITNSRDHSNSTLNIGFGDSPIQQKQDGDEENGNDATKKRKSQSARKAKKKRRKIITDNSELSSAHIRQMLDDTSRIMMKESDREPYKSERSIEERFFLPCMHHDLLPDAVLAVWRNNMSMAMGKSVEYEMKSDDAEDEEAPVENPRQGDATDDAAMPKTDANDDSFPMDDDQQPQEDDGIPFDNDDQFPMDEAMPPMDQNRTLPLYMFLRSTLFLTLLLLEFSSDDDRSVFSLGATNDLQDDIEIDEPVGSTKWHKNTIKVFEVLKYNLKEKDVISFQTLSKSATRRTAAGLFFEMLQLKTLNYIEIDQDESFGDIQITQGVRFDEDIST